MPKKILVITSHYPPYHIGGYELRIKDILEQLTDRGYKIRVVTSMKEGTLKLSAHIYRYEVVRKLHRRKKARCFIEELIFDLQDTALLDRQIKGFAPDILYLAHIMPLSKAIIPFLAERKTSLVFDEGGMGVIASWENRGRWFYFIEEYVSRYAILNKLKPSIIDLICKISQNRLKPKWLWPTKVKVIFNSELNYNNTISRNIPIGDALVVRSGIDTEKFDFLPREKLGLPILLIVPGRIEPPKGQMDAVRLLDKLMESGLDGKMIFVGENFSKTYFLEVTAAIQKLRLEDKIAFFPMLTQDELKNLYHAADICFFPSHHKTGYSRVPLEAMASGCIVVSYGNEGSNEIIQHGRTGFLVRPGDYAEIISIVEELKVNSRMVWEVTAGARREIEENCTLQRYIDEIEKVLSEAIRS
ncbi:MAG: glycosyltransferase family 4 protein [Anaerolineales bacterium]|jgi:glycosyltransferase involved in cell wall biosynthesis|nr:glycosyltransferase family 4 protein [Anaerolineales bacterium]GER80057.1 glycosyltransferase family 4 protein [Candidatus Denitrolinea symbiosum]